MVRAQTQHWRRTTFAAAASSVVLTVVTSIPCSAQDRPAARTRAEVIANERADKVAELWPERQSAMVNTVNGLTERGIGEGVDSGQGANGLQVVFGGTRPGQGLSAGIGYRRSDLWRERVSARLTARGTVLGAYLLDADVDFQGLRSERTFLGLYTKLEHSPRIDYYGQGNQTDKAARSRYGYRDITSDVMGGFGPVPLVRLGITGGYLRTYVSANSGTLPSIEEAFVGEPGPAEQETGYFRMGLFLDLDARDSSEGPRRGTLFSARFREYWDVAAKSYAFRESELEFQHYLPYFNATRVLAFRAAVVLTYPKGNDVVPVYLQPTIGGNDNLRGFGNFRFRGNNSLSLGIEHRWHAFSSLDMAVFADAGKVAQVSSDINLKGLHASGGLGFRVRLRSAVVTRIDFAASREGFRAMWTFSDIFQPKDFLRP